MMTSTKFDCISIGNGGYVGQPASLHTFTSPTKITILTVGVARSTISAMLVAA